MKLSNGDLLTGELAGIEKEQVVWKSPILGTLTIPRSKVAELDGKPLVSEDRVKQEQRVFAGRLTLGLEKDEGSSDSEEYDFDIKSSLTHGRYVHSVVGEYEAETKNDRTSEEDYEVEYQAERYFGSPKGGWFAYALAAWNKDRFREPQEWITLGSGAGYLWQPSKRTRIKYQMGLDLWQTSGERGTRHSVRGGRVMLDLQHKLSWLADMVIFHESEMLWEIAGSSTRRIETTTGLRVPLTERLRFELSAEHDRFRTGGAPEFDVSRNDRETEWNAKIGYAW
ncbi:MAG: DUF481 domain-containing protein [Pseudomonadales bacterium]